MLHALSTRRAAGFEAANSLNRVRNELSDPALAYLALTFANLDRVSLANELIGILAPRAKTEATAPGRPSRVYWSNSGRSQAIRGAAETTALVALAYRSRPAAGPRARRGGRLAPGPPRRHRLAAAQGQGAGARRAGLLLRPGPGRRGPLQADRHGQRHPGRRAQRHRLGRRPGDRRAAQGAQGRPAQPRPVRRWRDAAALATPSRLRASPAISSPTRTATNRVATINRRVYLPAAPELDGKVLPVGFGVARQRHLLRKPGQPGRTGRQEPASRLRRGARFPTRHPNGSAIS